MFLPAVIQNQNQNQGLNGFWNRLGKLAKKLLQTAVNMVMEISIIGPIVGEVLELAGATNSEGQLNWKNGTIYEPTPTEEAVITLWFNSRVLPFYKILSTQLSRAFQQNTPQLQIEAINKVMTKICVIKEYHKTQNVAGLSKNAIEWRSGLIDEILLPLENLITTSVSKINGVVMENASASATTVGIDFSGLINLTGFNLANYTCKNYRLTNSSTTVIAPVVTLPPTQSEPAKEVVIPVNGNPNVPAVPGETVKKSSPIVPIALGFIAVYLISDGLTSKKKSK